MDDFDPTAFERDVTGEEEEEQQQQDTTYKQLPHKQAQLIVIDCHAIRPLFANEAINWKDLFVTLTEYAKGRIISNDSDKWGLLLYGTEKTSNQFKMPNLVEVLPIDFLDVHAIKTLMELSTFTFDKFLSTYGAMADVRTVSQRHKANACPMSAVFRYALRALRTAAPVFKYTRKILLFTHRPDPCANLPEDRAVATQLGLDLVNNNVVIDLFPISLTSSRVQFDLALFYQEIVEASTKRGLANVFEAQTDLFADQRISEKTSLTMLSTLKVELKRRATQTRVLQKTELKIAPGLCISTAVFLVIGEAKKPAPVLLRADDHKPLYSETVWIDSVTGNLLARDEMRKFYDFDGSRVNFTEEEMNEIRAVQTKPRYRMFPNVDPAERNRMTILGFKPLSALDRQRMSIKLQVYFLFASETEIQGSSRTFHALVRAMWSLRRMAVITWQYRANSAPRMFAGVPQIGEDADGRPLVGIFLIALPFADEVRSIPVETQVPEPVIDTAYEKLGADLGSVLDQLNLETRNVALDEIGNPALAHHFAGLEALALGAAEAPAVKDATLPDQAVFDQMRDTLVTLQDGFGTNRGKKRPAPSAASSASAPTHVDLEHIRALAANDKVGTLTVPQLKSALTLLGLQVSGRKAELVERLQAHFKAKNK